MTVQALRHRIGADGVRHPAAPLGHRAAARHRQHRGLHRARRDGQRAGPDRLLRRLAAHPGPAGRDRGERSRLTGWRGELPSRRRHPRVDRVDRHPGPRRGARQPRPVPGGRADRRRVAGASSSRSRSPSSRPAYSGLGEEASIEAAGRACDVVLNGITGAVGLRPTLAALDAGNTLALANKESLIIGGPLVTARARPGQIVPVDTEHSALAQCLRGGAPAEVRRLVLTASGGPFRGRTRERAGRRHARGGAGPPDLGHGPGRHDQLRDPGQQGPRGDRGAPALRHPVRPDRGRRAPDSVVHSMVEFTDGSTLAQARRPTMLIPIALGLAWPDRVPDAAPAGRLDEAADLGVLPARRRGVPRRTPGPRGGGARAAPRPAVYNAANEVCVEAFRAGRLPFTRHRRHGRATSLGRHAVPSGEQDSPSTTCWPPTPGRATRRHV